MNKITEVQLEELRTPRGGFTKKTLAILGVPWPPPKGWKKKLLGDMPIRPKKIGEKKKTATKRKRKNFYSTWAWVKLRYEVLAEGDGRCVLCGRSKAEGTYLQVDHIKPLKTHPELALVKSNLQVLCGACNFGKGNWDKTDWR